MKRRILAVLCLITVLGFILQACEEDKIEAKIGICLPNPASNDFNQALKTYAERNLNKYGLPYRIYQTSAAKNQSQLIDSMVVAGCEVMIIVPDGSDIRNSIRDKVNNAGIPLIFAKSAVVGADYDAFIVMTDETLGASAAQFFNKQENINKIALFTLAEDESTTALISGLKAALKDELKDKWVEIELETYDVISAQTATRLILQTQELSDINAIYTMNDAMALGILNVLEAEENEQIKAVVGLGGSSEFLSRIKSSENVNLATTLYSPEPFMAKSVEVANNILNGISPESKNILLPSELVDKDNIDWYY